MTGSSPLGGSPLLLLRNYYTSSPPEGTVPTATPFEKYMKYYFLAFDDRLPYSDDDTVVWRTMLQISVAYDLAYLCILEYSCIS